MADRVSASIVLGGTLSHIHVDDLIAAIGADRLCVDYGDRPLDKTDIISGFPLYDAATGVAGASFDAVDAFCRDHGLHYVRRSDAYPGSAGASPGVRNDDRLIRLSSREHELATILEFDPDASLAPGSLQPDLTGDGDCLVPASRFSLETWTRLAVGVDGHDDGDAPLGGVSRLLDRRRAVLAA